MQTDMVLAHHSVAPTATMRPGQTGMKAGHDEGEAETNGQPAERGGAAVGNRRSSTRFSAVNDRLWIGWWAGDEFVLIQAHLVNISEGGVLVGVNPSPAQGQLVWMRLEGSSTVESLAAVVLESKWMMLKRRFDVRLAFQRRCPSEFYQAAIYGPDAPSARA